MSQPVLTLHQGTNTAAYGRHPTEIARDALLTAAEAETPEWAAVIQRFASALPHRGTVRATIGPQSDPATGNPLRKNGE